MRFKAAVGDAAKRTVLIVDDEEVFLCSLSDGLSDYSSRFCIMTAENGEKALEILKNTEVDLIVTDLRMPVMDGFELLKQLRKDHPNLPVMVMSAHITSEAQQRLSKLGVSRYLEKPLDYKHLVGILSGSLEGPRGSSAVI